MVLIHQFLLHQINVEHRIELSAVDFYILLSSDELAANITTIPFTSGTWLIIFSNAYIHSICYSFLSLYAVSFY